MTLRDEIIKDVNNTIFTKWSVRKGQIVPSTEDVRLAGGAVELDATFLYADLANSSKMASTFNRSVTAKILKSFLAVTARLVKSNGGTIVSFDGDRIMGVFLGAAKNTNAAKCGLQINYSVNKIIKEMFEKHYSTVENASFKISQGVGIDTGEVIAVRAGARGDNDLVWVGTAPNVAAKLSDIRESPHHTYITASVYQRLANESKLANGVNMWEERDLSITGVNHTIYRSHYWWQPD